MCSQSGNWPDPPTGEYGSKDPETIKYNRQKSRRLTRARSIMGTVVDQDGDRRTAVNYYEALKSILLVATVCLASSWLRSRASIR